MRAPRTVWLTLRRWQRLAVWTAMAVFVVYLYSPVEVMDSGEAPIVFSSWTGWDDVFSALKLSNVRIMVTPMTFTELGWARRLVNLPMWPSAARELVFFAGLIVISQMLFICGRAGGFSRRVRIAFVCLFFLCAAERLWDAIHRLNHRYIGGHVCYGIWMSPVFFTLAACGLIPWNRNVGSASEATERCVSTPDSSAT